MYKVSQEKNLFNKRGRVLWMETRGIRPLKKEYLQTDWLSVDFVYGNKIYKVSQKRIFANRLAER